MSETERIHKDLEKLDFPTFFYFYFLFTLLRENPLVQNFGKQLVVSPKVVQTPEDLPILFLIIQSKEMKTYL